MKCVKRINKIFGLRTSTQTEKAFPAIHYLKRSKSFKKRQFIGVNQALLVRLIVTQPDTFARIRNK